MDREKERAREIEIEKERESEQGGGEEVITLKLHYSRFALGDDDVLYPYYILITVMPVCSKGEDVCVCLCAIERDILSERDR